jgi:hypothetical protein
LVFVIELFLELIEAAVNGMMVMAVRWFSGFGSRARFTGMAGRAMWADNNWTRMALMRMMRMMRKSGTNWAMRLECRMGRMCWLGGCGRRLVGGSRRRMANGRIIGSTETPGIDFIVGSVRFFRCCY